MEFVHAALEQHGVPGTDLPSAAMVQIELECWMVCPDDTQMLDK